MPVVITSSATLPVMESFYTLQGEGHHSGKAAYFVRLGGCDVGCHWCDVKESWDASEHPVVAVESIVSEAKQHPGEMVVITGGEPLMYDLNLLCRGLRDQGMKVHLETSGAYPLSGSWDWICFSPKKFKQPLPEFYEAAHELKVVIYNKSDFSWAEQHASKINSNCKLYLQPEWSRCNEIGPGIVEYIKSHPRWELSLQIHKYLNIP